jgi:YebC/PmpR family DNA-binding regulatory protein
MTDNRNRTGSEVRLAFDRGGGSLGEPGSVAWQFEKKGVVRLDGSRYSDDDVIGAIDAGAEDVVEDEDTLKITCEPQSLTAVRESLTESGVEIESAELSMEPQNLVEVTDAAEARRLIRLIEALDDHDDVDEVHSNFDISAELMEEAEAAA